jgi:hypothetical protein
MPVQIVNYHYGDVEIRTFVDHGTPKLLPEFSEFGGIRRKTLEVTEGTVNRMYRQSQIFKPLFYKLPILPCPGIKMNGVGPELYCSKTMPGYSLQSFMEAEIFKSPR